jgi:hypothetical protein
MVYDLIGKRAQINSSSICSTFTPMHASSSSAADAAETVAHENSAIFARALPEGFAGALNARSACTTNDTGNSKSRKEGDR